MDALDILLPGDGLAERKEMIALCQRSLELLVRPFRPKHFNLLSQISSGDLRTGRVRTGDIECCELCAEDASVHSVYVNWVFFGLYSSTVWERG